VFLCDPLKGSVVGEDFTVNPQLAHAPGDELGVLRSKIKDDDFFMGVMSPLI
jgi:hypothetical protein